LAWRCGLARVTLEVERGTAMTKCEDALELASKRTGSKSRERSERQFELDAIDQARAFCIDFLKAVQVTPSQTKARNQLVSKLFVSDVVSMSGMPRDPERADSQSELQLGAVFDPSLTIDDPKTLPGWNQPLERSGRGVPSVESLTVDRELRFSRELSHASASCWA
jgi:hypothetical protein